MKQIHNTMSLHVTHWWQWLPWAGSDVCLCVYQEVVVFALPACLRSCRQSELRCWRTAWQELGPAHPARHHLLTLRCKLQTSWPPDRRSHRSKKSTKTYRLVKKALITSCTNWLMKANKRRLMTAVMSSTISRHNCLQGVSDFIHDLFCIYVCVLSNPTAWSQSSPWCHLRSGRAQWRWSLTPIQATRPPSESTLMEGSNLSSECTRLQTCFNINSLQFRCCFKDVQ